MKKRSNQKIFKISRQRKRLFITTFLILLLINTGLLISEAMKKEVTEETRVLASFSNTPGVSYQVYLKENALYNDTVQPEDIGYFTSLLDHIEVTFENKYKGADGAEYKGDYTIKGEITGWELGADNPTPAWTKQFAIKPKKTFSTNDNELIISQSADIDFNHFNSFVAGVRELTGYSTTYSLKVFMAINYTITTEKGEISESLQPSITIPLGEKYFKISKSGMEEKKNDITEIVQVPVPLDYIKISLLSTLSLLCLILLILFILAGEPTLTDLQRKQVKKILKNHGKRLVALGENLLVSESQLQCYVNSIDDIVRLSDEIERPIFYEYRSDPAEIREFFLIDKEIAYIFKPFDSGQPERQSEEAEKKQMVS